MKQNRPTKPIFQAALQSDGTLELLVYEEIGENFWTGGGITAKSIKDQIDFAGNFSRLALRINSPGGDAFEGSAIYNVLRAQKKPVDVYVDGIAASAASIIAMAGDTITMGPNAMMMIHNAWGQCAGFAAEMRKMADVLDKVSDSIGKVYVTRTGKAASEIADMMDAETWMTADECLAAGFCTQITADADQEIEENAMALARRFKVLRRMKNVPPALARNSACRCDCDSCQDGECLQCTGVDCVDPNCLDCAMQDSIPSASAPVSIEAALAVLGEREAALADDAVTVADALGRIDDIEAVLRSPMEL